MILFTSCSFEYTPTTCTDNITLKDFSGLYRLKAVALSDLIESTHIICDIDIEIDDYGQIMTAYYNCPIDSAYANGSYPTQNIIDKLSIQFINNETLVKFPNLTKVKIGTKIFNELTVLHTSYLGDSNFYNIEDIIRDSNSTYEDLPTHAHYNQVKLNLDRCILSFKPLCDLHQWCNEGYPIKGIEHESIHSWN